jgi:phosphoesterase RecJ-like protein
VVREAAACGEIVYRLFRHLGVELELSEAEALYVAILSDTGCFRFPTTRAETLRIAGDLVDLGVSTYKVASEIFWKRSPGSLRLLSGALSTVEVCDGGAVAVMVITRDMYADTGATPRDSEGFANYPRSIRDVQVGVLVREVEQGRFRVSLRSREGFAIDGVAKAFGGGGHPTAAGFRIEGQLESVKARIVREIHARALRPGPAASS